MGAPNLSRRSFVVSASAMLGGIAGLGIDTSTLVAKEWSTMRKAYHLYGIPLRSGSLYPGNEDDAQSLRDAGILARLTAAGCTVTDHGNINVPSYLPHHSIPPIRSWPGPRIVWDCVSETIAPHLSRAGEVPLLIGCDCSVVVGTVQTLQRVSAPDVHLIYIDGDFDDSPPTSDRSQSAASVALWLLTHTSPFWSGTPLTSSQITVVGVPEARAREKGAIQAITSSELHRAGGATAARRLLDRIPRNAHVIVHFDVDVLRQDEFPAAYFPHQDGITLSECSELLAYLAADDRTRIVEVAEYAALRDGDRRWATTLADVLARGLGERAQWPSG